MKHKKKELYQGDPGHNSRVNDQPVAERSSSRRNSRPSRWNSYL